MTTRKKLASTIGGAATIAAVIGMTAGLAPASAAPKQTPGTRISIVEDIVNPTYYRVILNGVYPMQQPDAVGFIVHLGDNRCGGMHYIVWGDDDGKEQYLFDRNFPGTHEDIEGYLKASPQGLEYRREFLVPKSALDEDKDGQDEVFVRARFVDGDCESRIQNTNTVKRNL
jgi:hypothetical protein